MDRLAPRLPRSRSVLLATVLALSVSCAPGASSPATPGMVVASPGLFVAVSSEHGETLGVRVHGHFRELALPNTEAMGWVGGWSSTDQTHLVGLLDQDHAGRGWALRVVASEDGGLHWRDVQQLDKPAYTLDVVATDVDAEGRLVVVLQDDWLPGSEPEPPRFRSTGTARGAFGPLRMVP